MCAGSILANREFYLTFIRLINSFKSEEHNQVGAYLIHGNADPTSLVVLPKKYRVKFIPRREKILAKELRIIGIVATR